MMLAAGATEMAERRKMMTNVYFYHAQSWDVGLCLSKTFTEVWYSYMHPVGVALWGKEVSK